jgi:hypothetical protein
MPHPIPRLILPALLLLPACSGSGGSFPSLLPRPAESPREIAAPGADVLPALAPEQQASLRADLARERALLDQTESDLREAGAALDRALGAARGTRAGADAWSNAQMALSRYDLARSPLGDVRARLIPLQRSVDSLPATDPDRQAVETLAARATTAADAAQRQVDAANRALAA